jgi:ComF family protein
MIKTPLFPQTSIINPILSAIHPPRCAGCGLWWDALFCATCEENLEPIESPLCHVCGLPFDKLAKVTSASVCEDCRSNRYHSSPPLATMRAPFTYAGPIREAVHQLKYNSKTARARPMATLLHHYLTGTPEGQSIPLERVKFIVPIPLHCWRQWRRGHNQSLLLAKELAQLLESQAQPPCVVEILRRSRHTVPQADLHADERALNIKGAFTIAEKYQNRTHVKGEGILLLDDVSTTGATLYECARVLHKSGGVAVEDIFALTLARAV